MNTADNLGLNDSMSQVLSHSVDSMQLGGRVDTAGNNIGAGTFDQSLYQNTYPYVEKFYPNYYTSYWTNYVQDSKLEKAFRLAQKLIEKKFIKEPKTVKDFIVLVNTLADEL